MQSQTCLFSLKSLNNALGHSGSFFQCFSCPRTRKFLLCTTWIWVSGNRRTSLCPFCIQFTPCCKMHTILEQSYIIFLTHGRSSSSSYNFVKFSNPGCQSPCPCCFISTDELFYHSLQRTTRLLWFTLKMMQASLLRHWQNLDLVLRFKLYEWLAMLL